MFKQFTKLSTINDKFCQENVLANKKNENLKFTSIIYEPIKEEKEKITLHYTNFRSY